MKARQERHGQHASEPELGANNVEAILRNQVILGVTAADAYGVKCSIRGCATNYCTRLSYFVHLMSESGSQPV